MPLHTPLFFTFYMLFAFAATAQSNFYHDGSHNSRRTIRQNSIREEQVYRISQSNFGGQEDSVWQETILYDTAGKITERSYKMPGMKVGFRQAFLYDTINRLQREITTYLETGLLVSTTQYWYDTVKRTAHRLHYNKDTTRLVGERRQLNEKGQPTELYTRLNNDEYYLSQKYDYAPQGNLLAVTAFNPKGDHLYSYQYEVSRENNTVTKFLKERKKLLKEEVFLYNKIHQCISRKKFNPDEQATPKMITEISYHADGTLAESITRQEERVLNMIRHHYSYNR